MADKDDTTSCDAIERLFRCSTCKQYKPAEGFYKNKSHASGYSNTCTACRKKSISQIKAANHSLEYDVSSEELVLCKKCGTKKLLAEFHKDFSRKNGHCIFCKTCACTNKRKEWEENKEEIKKRTKISRDKRKDKQKIYNKNYGLRKKKAISANKKAYARKNPEKIRARNQRRRVLIKNGVVEKFLDIEIFERDRWICQICLKKVNKRLKHPHPLSHSIDHIIPIADGGAHTRQNSVLAHLLCNTVKGDRTAVQQQRLF